jgi:hypothetical protein
LVRKCMTGWSIVDGGGVLMPRHWKMRSSAAQGGRSEESRRDNELWGAGYVVLIDEEVRL